MRCVRGAARGSSLTTALQTCGLGRQASPQLRSSFFTKTRRMAVNASETATQAEMQALWATFQQNQKDLPIPTIPELSRTLVQNSKQGLLSVLSGDEATQGFPFCNLVAFAAGEDGKPVFSFTDLATHTRFVRQDDRVSLLVTEGNELNMSDARVTLMGRLVEMETGIEELKAVFRKKHADAVYLDFGDFHMYKMEEVIEARFVRDAQTGSTRTGTVSGEAFLEADPDPVAEFSRFICRHMNDDHQKDNLAMVEVAAGFEMDRALLKRVDRLGADFTCRKTGFSPIACRVAFSSPALKRADVKDRIVECTIQAHKQTNNKYRNDT